MSEPAGTAPITPEELQRMQEELLKTQLQMAKLELAEKGVRLKVRQDTAARIEEANNITRIGPLDG